ncbi:MAG: D-TA family PLP-dependent enzyme [Eudoraea sp.]|uniref:D-TA family PLP-dependent enzyme n=1 Tax=Eudoraea sp. TaxID=1979955 RepID=UPI003266C1EE
MADKNWYELDNPEEIVSPSLLVYPDRIEKNIALMISIIGDVTRLRPHIKTHKTAEIIEMQMQHGIQKFKCATIAEAELLAQCGAKDILLAMQAVGANLNRFFKLIATYPNSVFSTIVDNEITIGLISEMAASKEISVPLFLDLNTGMNRTGIEPNDCAVDLFKQIADDPNLDARGLHAYDGHIRDPDIKLRKQVCDAAFNLVINLKNKIEALGLEVKTLVMGGSPSFPIHAARNDVETSPGTTLLWDERYGSSFKDMPFLPAAVLLTRIISKPKEGVICLDLGHKAIAPEMDFPRVKIFGLEDAEQTGQSEEHLVLHYPKSETLKIGDIFYAIPMHICPTVAKYSKVLTVDDGQITGAWKIAARDHQMQI